MPTASTSIVKPSPEAGLNLRDVCTLPPEDIVERKAWVRAEILPHAIERESGNNFVRVELEERIAEVERMRRVLHAVTRCRCPTLEDCSRSLRG